MGSPSGESAYRDHRGRRGKCIEPLRVPHRIQIVNGLPSTIHSRSPWRNAGMLATGHSSTEFPLISPSVLARSRSRSAHASSNSVAVSGGVDSAMSRNSLKIGLS